MPDNEEEEMWVIKKGIPIPVKMRERVRESFKDNSINRN
jgi:hypothetical protein